MVFGVAQVELSHRRDGSLRLGFAGVNRVWFQYNLAITCGRSPLLTRAALGSPAERAALGEGVIFTPPLLTQKLMAVEANGRRQSKAHNEKVLMRA